MIVQELNEIYKELCKIDQHVAETYKNYVFKHIERILIKYGIEQTNVASEVQDVEAKKDINLIKIAIKNLVDYL